MSKQPQHSQTSPEEQAAKQEEEVHVPRGQSRARFLIILGLLIAMLVIYVVPQQFQSVFRPADQAEAAFMVWNHPQLGRQEMTSRDFVFARRRFDNFFRLVNGGKDARLLMEKDDQFARILILDRLAQDAGIEVSTNEVKQVIKDGGFILLSKSKDLPASGMMPDFFFQVPAFQNSAAYVQALDAASVKGPEFEGVLRTMLRVQRFEAMLGVVAQPDGAAIEKAWKERHMEHRFDVAAFDVTAAAPALELPDDAALQTWYDALDQARTRALFPGEWKPERVGAELFVWLTGNPMPEALLAKYPRAEGTDLEQLAQSYYNQFAHVRFRRESEKTDATTNYDRMYKSFEEVREQALAESKLDAALVDWQASIQARFKAGEIVDMMSEALAMGVQYVKIDVPRTQAEWSADPSLGDENLTQQIMSAGRGDKFIPLTVGAKQMVLGRALEWNAPAPPPLAEVRERVLEEWKKEKAAEAVRTKAQAMVDALRPAAAPAQPDVKPQPKADEAAFAAQAQSAGATVTTTEWLDAARLPESAPEGASDAERFAYELSRSARAALGSELDGVTGPVQSSDAKRVFVARHVAKREPETVAIEPGEYQQIEARTSYEGYRAMRDGILGVKGLEQRFGLAFPVRTNAPEDQAPSDAPPKG